MLLLVLSILFAAWVAFLIVLYVTTVYPQRHRAPTAPPVTQPADQA